MAITNLAGRYLQDSFKFVTQNSQSFSNPDIWDFADGEAVPITWINATASWAATASVALGLEDNIWVRSTGSNSAVLNDSGSNISVAYGTSSIGYGYRTTASGDFSQAQGSGSHALSIYSHAEGILTSASALGTHTEGYKTVAGNEVLVTPAVPAFYTTANYKATTAASTLIIGPDSLALKPYNSYWVRGTTTDWISLFTNGYNQQNYTNIGAPPVYYPAAGAYSMSLRLTNGPADSTLPIYAIYAASNGGFAGYWIVTATQGTFTPDVVEGTTSNPAIPQVPNPFLASAFTPFTPAVYAYTGSYSHTEGANTRTLGVASHAEGVYTTASGDYSHAEGSASISYGTASHADGLHTIASGSFQTVVGRYNKHNNTEDYFVVGDGTMDIPISRSNALGVNATRFYASNSIYFPDLVDTQYQHIVMFDTASGQINYYTASGLGGGGTPGGPNGSIQFNSASTFSGSSYLTYNYQNSQLILTGSQIIDLSGSNTALQIINDCDGQVAQLTNLPFLPNNTFRLRPLVYVPSSSSDPNIKGQLWFIHEDNDARPKPAQIFEVTSSNGDLRFKGYIGSSSGTPPSPQGINGRLMPPAIHASNFPNRGRVLVGDRYSNGLVAYDPDKVAAQPNGFTYNYPSAQDTALYEYISPLTGSNGNGLRARRYTATVNNITFTPSASVQYYSVFNIAVSKSDAGYATDDSLNPLLAGTYLSKSINDLYNAGLPLSGAADHWPLGFFMSTFDGAVATNTQYVDLSTQLLALGLEKRRIFSGSITVDSLGVRRMNQLPYNYGSYTVNGEYNSDLNRIYVTVNFGGGLHPYVGYVELDNDTSPPTVVGYTTSSLGLIYHAGITYNSTTKDLLIRDDFSTTYKIYDATSTINWNTPKATITMPTDFVGGQLTGFYYGTPIASGNDFYLAGGKPAPSSGQKLFSIIFESQSTGYVVKTGSLAEDWESALPTGTRKATHGITPIAFGSNINKFFIGNNSEIGPVGNPDTADESSQYRAKSNKIYSFTPVDGSPTAFNTPSQIVFDPYTYDVNRIGNFVEFIDCAGEVLSYVDANGVFQGTASYASNVLPGGSSVEFYSGSVLQTSNLDGLVISGSYLNSQVNGNQVTMSLDLSSILNTFTSQSFGSSLSWTFTHNLDEWHPLITVYDNNHEVVIPQDVVALNANTVQINFSAATAGYAVAGAGPFTGLTRYPISFYSSSTLQTSDLRSLVITGSGVTSTLNGNQITMSFTGGGGSANPGGGNTTIQFNYNGNALSGSNNFTFISQSNTVLLTGSLNLSGSATITSGTITALTPVVGGVGFIGTSSWAANAQNISITGDTSLDRDWKLTFTRYTGTPNATEVRDIYADPQLEYNTKYNQLLINATGSKINEQTGSNIAVNTIQPAGLPIQIGSSRSGSVCYLNLSSSVYNNNVYGLVMNYTITADHTLVAAHDAEDHNEDPSTGGIPYVETGTITVTWTGRDSDYNNFSNTFDTDPAAYYTIVTPLPAAWRLQGTTYGEIDADEVYSYAPKYTTYRHDTDLQFGYKLVNNTSPSGVTTGEWYFEIVLWNQLPARVEFVSNTNLLTYNQSL